MRRYGLALFLAFGWLAATVPPAIADELADAYRDGFARVQDGQPKAALPYFERALELARARYGRNDQRVAIDLNNLGEIYRQVGRYADAERALKEALRLDEQKQRPDAAGLATTLNNLALVYRAQGRLGEAQPLYERSLALLEKGLGPDHPDVARSLNNLAVLHLEQKQPDRALPLAERANAIADRQLGPEDPAAKLLAANLAAVRRALGKPAVPADPAPTRVAAPASGPANAALAAEPAGRSAAASIKKPAAPSAGRTGADMRTWAVHLASLDDPKAIPGEWRRLAKIYPELSELDQRSPQQIEVAGKGTFWRVLAGELPSRAAAEQACAPIKAKGGYCAPVRP